MRADRRGCLRDCWVGGGVSHRATGRHDMPTIKFRWNLPRLDPAWLALLGSIKDVRAVAGQDGVDKFIAEWRKRGYLECSDEDAARLAKP